MRKGVTESVCLLIFLSGRKETAGHPDLSGLYEGPFTRWLYHEEMHAAHICGLKLVGVKEDDSRHGKPDFGQEKTRAMKGKDGGPVNEHAADNLHLLDDVCFIDFRRQQHEVPGMLGEIERQFVEDAPLVRTLSPQSASSSRSTSPEPEVEAQAETPIGPWLLGHRVKSDISDTLDTLGVDFAEDLLDLEAADVAQIAAHLEGAQAKRFLRAVEVLRV